MVSRQYFAFLHGLALALALGTAAAPVEGQENAVAARSVVERVRGYRERNEGTIVRELMQLLSIPNVASDSVAIRRNADLLARMMERRGIETRLLHVPGSPPAVYGELRAPGALRTVMLYAHYDGQPVDPGQWAGDPWTPVLRDGLLPDVAREIPLPSIGGRFDPQWRLYARSASDDKSPIVAMLSAIDALRAAGIPPSVNLKFFLEGEEEAGSPHLREMLERHRDLLRADVWIFGDGPVHQSRRMQVVFGVRGVVGLEMTVYGPSRALHSGHYGNWAPNPAALVARLLASMRDEDGVITIPGFYDDVRPLSAAERAALASVPDADSALRRELALARTEAGDARLIERITLPALNVRGIETGSVGERAANAIPTEARASVDFRLVPDQTPASVRAFVERHIRLHGYHVVSEHPSDSLRRAHPRVVRLQWEGGYPATRTSVDHPAAYAVLRVLDEALGTPMIRVPTLGGSLPMYLFEEILGAPLLVVPIVNHDNNQHAANENLRLQNLWDGIEMYAVLMARLGARWRATPPVP